MRAYDPTGPVAVLTQLDDVTADYVIAELHDRGVPVVRLDPGRPDGVTFAAQAGPGAWHGPLRTPTRAVDLGTVRALYHRRPSVYQAPQQLDDQQRRFTAAQVRHGLSGLLAALPDCLYVNHPHHNWNAEYKPRQITTAVAAGLDVPPTLVTNDPGAAQAFAEEHGPVVYKPLRATDYREDGQPRTVWVRPVDPADLDERIAVCPHLFQQQVEKVADVRVAAVGRRLFATRIGVDGDHLDWRLDYRRVTFSPTEVPTEVREGIHRYLSALGLVFGAFDFGLSAEGRWRFYECNPNGQWAFVDETTTRALTSALADLWEKGTSP